MGNCYHSECDKFSQDIATREKYKFLTSTAQSVMLSVAEIAMENSESSCILRTVQHIVEKASNAQEITTSKKLPTSEAFKPKPIPRFTPTTMSPTVQTLKTTSKPTFEPLSPVSASTPSIVDYGLDHVEALIEALRRKLPKSFGTQINIDTVNININQDEKNNQCLLGGDLEDNSGIVLGSDGQLDSEVLANVVKNFLAEKDRRKYKGKQKNSPMVIKFVPTPDK